MAATSQTDERVPVLILEPDQWRFRGISAVLDESGAHGVVGERDYAKILTVDTPPNGLIPPRVALVAHRLLLDYGLSVVPHLRDLFADCRVLIHGDGGESLETAAEMLAAGASGYYSLRAPMGYLPRAVTIVSRGKIWGSREAVELMARRAMAHTDEPPTGDEAVMLQFLNDGLSNKEIAQRLQLAEVTVKTRLGRLYRKFGVSTRLQLLSAAMKRGLINPE